MLEERIPATRPCQASVITIWCFLFKVVRFHRVLSPALRANISSNNTASLLDGLHYVSHHEYSRYFRHDCVSVGAQSSQLSGYPIAHRHRSGTRRPWGIPEARSAHFAKSSVPLVRMVRSAYSILIGVRFQSVAVGVGMGRPPQSVTPMGSPDATSWHNCRRCGVATAFQVSAYMVEPREASSACNLFAKDCCRRTLCNEPEERRP